jgi:hypothetical protein
MTQCVFKVLSTLSFALCLGITALWTRSCSICDTSSGNLGHGRTAQVASGRGRVAVAVIRGATYFTPFARYWQADSRTLAAGILMSDRQAYSSMTESAFGPNGEQTSTAFVIRNTYGVRTYQIRVTDVTSGIPTPISDVRYYAIPYSTCLLISGVLPAAWLTSRRLSVWNRSRPLKHPKGHCSACGYDLRATPGRCPECGNVPAGTRPRA